LVHLYHTYSREPRRKRTVKEYSLRFAWVLNRRRAIATVRMAYECERLPAEERRLAGTHLVKGLAVGKKKTQ